MRLWNFALAAWDRPGVSEICLQLQDRHGQCVPLLLWRAWAAAEGRVTGGELMRDAMALARAHERETIAPLRAARREFDSGAAAGLRQVARDTELGAERTLLNALEAITPAASSSPSDSGDGVGPALTALIQNWNGCKARSAPRALAARLR